MRQIKFRAWDTVDQEMTLMPFAIVNDPRNRDPDYWKPLPWMIVKPNRQWVGSATSRYIPMQFTGLLDKNDKEIYEGDVIDYIRGGRWGKRSVIEYQRGEFVLVRNGEPISYKTVTSAGWNRIKIIGNIYENPELINI